MGLASRIDTVFVPALDPVAAAAWYRRVFALETVFEQPDYVALQFREAGPRRQTALTLVRAVAIDPDAHPVFNFFTADPLALHAMLGAEGVETTAISAADGMQYFDFRDISGNWVNVCHFEEQD